LRSKRGMSQGKLAKEAGVGVVTIIRLESGGKAYPATLIKIAEALGLDSEELLEFEATGPNKGKPKPPPKPKSAPVPEAPIQEQVSEAAPVKRKFTGQAKDYAWELTDELGLTISQVKNYMMKNPGLMDLPYAELKKAVAEKFKKA
jgi:transcriptional regulator with XRE-family HTH domain